MTQQQHASRSKRFEYELEAIVLYRDPLAFWRGQDRHTYLCQVEKREVLNGRPRYTLVDLHTDTRVEGTVDPFFMRLLPAETVMRDIDTAPLGEADLGEMSYAAVAWLRQQTTDQPALPSADSLRST